MRLKPTLLAAVAAAVTFAAPANAHRMWLLPSTTTLADTNQYVTFDAAVSTDLFFADHVAMATEQVKAWTPAGALALIETAARGSYHYTFHVNNATPGHSRNRPQISYL